MFLRREQWIQGAVVILLWTALGVLSSAQMQLESSFSPRKGTLLNALVIQLSFTTICALLTPAILYLASRFRIDSRPYWPNVLLHLGASIAFTVISKSIWYPLAIAYEGRPFAWIRFFWSLVYSSDFCLVLYWMVVLISYLVEYYRRYQRGRLDAARLTGELAQAQLRWLKSRLHPHFLFNALHTISALVREDPRGAERMIARLSELLRLSLRDSGVQEVPLRQELEFLNLYLDIEKVRFEDRLVVNYRIEEGTENALVPSMVLQPLVENSIRHGIAPRAAEGQLLIGAAQNGSHLILTVRDNGVGLRSSALEPSREGVGLSTVRGRLEKLYGRSQSLVLRNLASGGVEAEITLPYVNNIGTSEVIHEAVSRVGS